MSRIVALALIVWLASVSPGASHAFLDRAVPGAGAETRAPATLVLTFSEAVEPRFSKISLQGDKGAIATPPPTASAGGRTLTVTLPQLAAGSYQVDWQITSVDTHRTQGHYRFTVRP